MTELQRKFLGGLNLTGAAIWFLLAILWDKPLLGIVSIFCFCAGVSLWFNFENRGGS